MYIDKFHPIVKCSYCGKEISIQNLKKHENKHKNQQEKQQQTFSCKKCGKMYVLYEGYSKKFCSISCANYRQVDKKATKESICIICGKKTLIKKHTSHKFAKCEDCKKIQKNQKKKKRESVSCQYCSREICAHNIDRHERACPENPKSEHISYNYKRKEITTGYIYKITNIINKKIYIGKKKGNPKDSKNYFGSGIAIKDAIKKYGKVNFTKEILERIDNGDLDKRERFWITELRSNIYEIGYNLTKGGDGGNTFEGKHHTIETIKKIKNTMIEKNKKVP
jgi:hypothetical protein